MEIKRSFYIFNVILLITLYSFPVYSQEVYSSSEFLVEGFNAFKASDYQSASFFLRKAVSDKENISEATLYMLIMASFNCEDYSSALADCALFEDTFFDSSLLPYVQYQKGRCLYYLGQLDEAVIVLSDFCHSNKGNEMEASALYYLAECFYADYKYDTAKFLYEKIVTEFPEDERVSFCLLRLEFLAQSEREEKLIYLLKLTGEESLSAREAYEKQLRFYQSEDVMELKKQLNEANERIKELENRLTLENQQVGE